MPSRVIIGAISGEHWTGWRLTESRDDEVSHHVTWLLERYRSDWFGADATNVYPAPVVSSAASALVCDENVVRHPSATQRAAVRWYDPRQSHVKGMARERGSSHRGSR